MEPESSSPYSQMSRNINYYIVFIFLTFIPCTLILSKFLLTNEYTSDYIKNNIKIYIKITPTLLYAAIASPPT